MRVIIEEAVEMIETEVKSYKTSTRVSVPKRWAHKKVKIILIDPKKIRVWENQRTFGSRRQE
jgi:putative transposon-encoded protein